MFERLVSNKLLTLSVLALLVAGIAVLAQLPGLMQAVFAPSIDDDSTPKLLQAALETHKKNTDLYRERFVGRSIFFVPPAPVVQVARQPVSEDTGPPPPPPPPPPPEIPAEYGGPAILALLGDEVHVTGPKVLKLGQEDPSLGLKVLEFVPPWSVKVEWLKKPGNYAVGTYVVEIFKSDDGVLSQPSGKSATPQGLTQAESPVTPPEERPRRAGAEPVED